MFDPIESFGANVLRELRLRDPDGIQISRLTDSREAARALADRVISAAESWDAHLGPFYSQQDVGVLLAAGGDPEVSLKQASDDLLALETGSGQVVYPAFQFEGGGPIGGLARVLGALPEALVSRWTVASWLRSPIAESAGLSPVELLRQGRVGVAVGYARRWAEALAA